jgi:PhzF family phenazine biosynthesis protein
VTVLRYAAFTETPEGGNPAGIVLDATGMSDSEMLAVAAEVGFSETAFAAPRDDGDYDVRYFSLEVEVAFCGHATIATAAALAERHGPGRRVFYTPAGEVPVDTDAALNATLTSIGPQVRDVPDDLLDNVLRALDWSPGELDPTLPPGIGFVGENYLIVAAATRARLADLDYDFEALKQAMLEHRIVTVDLVHRTGEHTFSARNPFPVGGVVEDPATGAAAAAFGAYLRERNHVTPPATVTVHQGVDMGRPSLLTIEIAADRPEIRVSGRAVAM